MGLFRILLVTDLSVFAKIILHYFTIILQQSHSVFIHRLYSLHGLYLSQPFDNDSLKAK